MVSNTTSERTPRRGFIVFLQSFLIVCWVTFAVAVAVLVSLVLDMRFLLPLDEPRPRVEQHVHTTIIWCGIGAGILGSIALAYTFARATRQEAR